MKNLTEKEINERDCKIVLKIVTCFFEESKKIILKEIGDKGELSNFINRKNLSSILNSIFATFFIPDCESQEDYIKIIDNFHTFQLIFSHDYFNLEKK